ncbi:MAG: undecaprenyl-diphosphate phosphatase, partial [Flavobacteriales bacterium]
IVATIPIVILGLSFGDLIKQYLFNVNTVAIALIVGGVIILWAERRPHHIKEQEVEQIGLKKAMAIGLIQCFALIPGTSRSGATIIGGLLMGVSRKAAAEFSFFLGIPVLMGAGLLDLYKSHDILHTQDWLVLGVGMVTAFISALIVIRALIRYVSNHDFTVFAWYRIIFGLLILITAYTGLIQW